MSADTPKPRTKMRPGMRALLIGSLAINLIVFGLVAGAALGNKRISNRPLKDGDVIGAYTRALLPEDRRAIGKAMREHSRENGLGREERRTQLQQMLAALKATPFDASNVKALMEVQSKQAFERRNLAQDLWITRLEAMTDEERAGFAKRLEEALKRRSGPKKGGKP